MAPTSEIETKQIEICLIQIGWKLTKPGCRVKRVQTTNNSDLDEIKFVGDDYSAHDFDAPFGLPYRPTKIVNMTYNQWEITVVQS